MRHFAAVTRLHPCWGALGLFALAANSALPPGAFAQASSTGYHASAHAPHRLASTERLDPTAAGTDIDTRERDAAQESLGDVLLEVPGARPFRTGSLGSFTSAALRGAEAEHTTVLLGEIPLTTTDAGAFDLSALPLSLTERVVVYRGGAPLMLSQGAIGGVIQLLPREARHTQVSGTMSAGSFGTYGLSTQSSVVTDRTRLLALTSLLGSQGDFPVAFDNKTAFDASDDYTLRRKNADFAQADGLMTWSGELGPGTLSLWLLGHARGGGEPGPPANPVLKARRHQLQAQTGIGYTFQRGPDRLRPALRVQVQGAMSLSRSRLADLGGEVGPTGGSLSQRRLLRSYARLLLEAKLSRAVRLSALSTLSQDDYRPTDAYVRVAQPDSSRTQLAGGAELLLHGELAGHRAELRPSVRVERAQARLHSERFGEVVSTLQTTSLATYRLAGALELFPQVTLSSSWSSGARIPSMLELFGDGALLLGNTALRPERSRSFDVGLSSVIRKRGLTGSFELRAFDLSIRDQVLFVRNSFAQLLPLNLAHARMRGIELGGRAKLRRYWLSSAITLLDTEGKPGKRLPNRPRATLLVQPGVQWQKLGPLDALRAFVELYYVASSFDDPDNQTLPKPPALFVDAGVSLQMLREHALLRVTVSDVFDRRGRDLRQFPLPGRTVMVSLTYREE